MKQDNGITLIKLICVIVIIITIISASAFSLRQSYEMTSLQKFVMEMEMIQEKVNRIRKEYKNWEDYDPQESENFYLYLQDLGFDNAIGSRNLYVKEFNDIIKTLEFNKVQYWQNTDSILSNYYYFSPKDIETKLQLKNIKRYVIINFYTGNVITKDGIADAAGDNNLIYRQYDTEIGNKLVIPEVGNSEVETTIEVLENNGLNQKIKISLESKIKDDLVKIPMINEVYYYLGENSKELQECSELSNYEINKEDRSVTFTIENSGNYSFVVEDTNHIKYKALVKEITLCNEPILLSGMTGVFWDYLGNEISVNNLNKNQWYNYSKEEFLMANARTEDGNYWVWVPRFIINKKDENAILEFVKDNSNIATSNLSTIGYDVHQAFKDDLKGIWVAKYQVSKSTNDDIEILPGKALSVENANKAKFICKRLNNKNLNFLNKSDSNIMSQADKDACLALSRFYGVEVANDLVHYSAGEPKEDSFKIIENMRYSNTHNITGVYDLITSENELLLESKSNEMGRFRPVIPVK